MFSYLSSVLSVRDLGPSVIDTDISIYDVIVVWSVEVQCIAVLSPLARQGSMSTSCKAGQN